MDLALKGMLLNNKKIENIRLDSSDCVFIESGASKAAVTFEKCYVFDTKKLNCKNCLDNFADRACLTNNLSRRSESKALKISSPGLTYFFL